MKICDKHPICVQICKKPKSLPPMCTTTQTSKKTQLTLKYGLKIAKCEAASEIFNAFGALNALHNFDLPRFVEVCEVNSLALLIVLLLAMTMFVSHSAYLTSTTESISISLHISSSIVFLSAANFLLFCFISV